MNSLSIFLISSLSITLIIYFILSRKTLKKITMANRLLISAHQKLYDDHRILVDQFRQLANINKALREVNTFKTKKK